MDDDEEGSGFPVSGFGFRVSEFGLRVRDRAAVIDDEEEGCVRVEAEMR